MSGIEELRRLLDERGVEHRDHYLSTTWRDGHGIIHLAGEPMADGSLVVDMLTPEQAIAATLCETYTREECEAAFVRGYSLGSLPVGSSPQWDENRQTVDGHMAELGWVRAATLGGGKLTADDVRDLIERHSDAYVITMTPYFADDERYPSLIGVRADGDEFETAYVKKSDMAAAVDYWQRMYEETVRR